MDSKIYSYQAYGNTYVVSIANHAEVMQALDAFVRETGINVGEITGLGAIDMAVLRIYDPNTKKYVDHTFNEQMEIANVTGNITMNNGDYYLHVHVTLGRHDCTALAGHLLSARISGACELIVRDLGKPILTRYKDEDTGLNLFDLR